MADMSGCDVTSRRLVLVSNCLCLLRCNFTIFYNCPIHNITVCEQSDRPRQLGADNEGVSPRPRHRIAGYKKSLNSHTCCKEAHYVQWIHYDFPSMCKEMIKLQFLLLGCSHDQCPGRAQAACHTTAIPDTGHCQARSISWAGILA